MNILIGYDGTTSADQAVEYVWRTFSANGQLRVHILYVESIPYVNGEFGVLPVPYDVTRNNDLLKKAEKLCKEHGITPSLQNVVGIPAEVIVDVANKRKVELIVLGAHNKGVLERLLLGSVSEAVARRAECSVLIVR